MGARVLRAILLVLALGSVGPAASAQPAGNSGTNIPLSVPGGQSRERVPPLVWVLILGATLVGLRSLRSSR